MTKNTFVLALFFSLLASAQVKTLEPYGDNPKLELTPEQREKLEKGELVFWEKSEEWPDKQFYKDGAAAFRVNATPEKVWKVIGDFNKYPDWAYKVGSAKEYKSSHDDKYYVEFKAQVVGKKYYIEHDFPMLKKGYGTWKTDKTQKSDCVLDTVGFWRVDPVKGNPNESDVYYSGKVVLSRLCAKGFLGMGGFNGPDMAKQTHAGIKKRSI